LIAAVLLSTLVVVFLVLNLSLGDKKIDQRVDSLYTTDDAQFLRTMGYMLGPALIPGNRVETLVNGDQIFPSLLKALRGARRTINFETYIYWQVSGQPSALYKFAVKACTIPGSLFTRGTHEQIRTGDQYSAEGNQMA